MTALLIAVIVVLAASLAAAVFVRRRPPSRQAPARPPAPSCQRILFPFVATALSRRALDAALRLARAESAALVPVLLVRVPLYLPLDAPLPAQAGVAVPLQEAIEHRAFKFGIDVDARVERGRTTRHALRQMIEHERFDRIVMAAAPHGGHGFDPEDVAWLLENAPGEIVVLRPGDTEDMVTAQSPPTSGHRLKPALTAATGPRPLSRAA